MFLAGLAVVFVGLAGPDPHHVDQQIQTVCDDLQVEPSALPVSAIRTLARHGGGSRELVVRLHHDGLIAGELVVSGRKVTLRLAIYAADGRLASMSEIPLAGATLGADELAVLRTNLEGEVSALAPAHPAAPAIAAPTPAPAAPEAATPAAADEATPAAPDEAAAGDTVRPEDLMAAMAGGDTTAASDAPEDEAAALRLRATVGVGVIGRSFAAPSTVASYSSTPIGALRIGAEVEPVRHVTLDIAAERTLGMTTPLAGGAAPTTISHWEVTGGYTLARGAVALTPQVGLGRRAFTIDGSDPTRTPDSIYDYLILGGAASLEVGRRITVRASLAVEPVVGGAEAMESAFGEARRWAIAGGGAVEARPWTHVVVRAAAEYQRFTWSWGEAGPRGAGGAVDAYPSGSLSLGAEY